MKLNLLPTYVKKGAQGRSFFILGLALALVGVGGAAFMNVASGGKVKAAREEMDAAKVEADRVVALASAADEVAKLGAEPKSHLDLYKAMDEHNRKYTAFYTMVRGYVPNYMRVNAMSVTPISETSCQLNLTGVIKTFQQYADTTIALMRIPGAKSVTRANFNLNDMYVPGLNETDNVALPYLLSDGRKPPMVSSGPDKGPDAQLAYLVGVASKAEQGFTGTGNFGTPGIDARHAMPDWSEVTYAIILEADPSLPADKQPNLNFLVPNPRQSVGAGAGAPGGAGGAGPSVAPPGGAGPSRPPSSPIPGGEGRFGPGGEDRGGRGAP